MKRPTVTRFQHKQTVPGRSVKRTVLARRNFQRPERTGRKIRSMRSPRAY